MHTLTIPWLAILNQDLASSAHLNIINFVDTFHHIILMHAFHSDNIFMFEVSPCIHTFYRN